MKSNKGTRFVVLTSQRSGSTWLMSILNSIENTSAYGELFTRKRRVAGANEWDSDVAYLRFVETEPNGLAFRPFSVFSYLDASYRQLGVVGFKLMYSQVRRIPETWAYLVRHRMRVVHLVRQNHLDAMISGAIAAKTGQAHQLVGQPDLGNIQIRLDLETLSDRLKRLRRNIMVARRLLRWCRLPHIEVAYEDLLRGPSHFSLIWDFLSIKHEGPMPQSNLVKRRKGGHVDVISNYHEVKEALASSTFAGLIK